MRPLALVSAALVAASAVLATGCSQRAAHLDYATDWRSPDLLLVGQQGDRPVLLGVDVAAGRVRPLAPLTSVEDFRRDTTSQVVVQPSGGELVVLPDGTAGGGVVSAVDRGRRRVQRRYHLRSAEHLASVGGSWVAAGGSDGRPAATTYRSLAGAGRPSPLPLTPTVAATGSPGAGVCYAGTGGSDVARFRPERGEVSAQEVRPPGTVTGIACGADQVVLAVGADRPEQPARVRLSRPAGPLRVRVLASDGLGGRVLIDGGRVVADVPGGGGERHLVAYTLADGRLEGQVSLPGLDGMDRLDALVRAGGSYVGVSGTRVLLVDARTWHVRVAESPVRIVSSEVQALRQ